MIVGGLLAVCVVKADAQQGFTWLTHDQVRQECILQNAMTVDALRYRIARNNLVTEDEVKARVVADFTGNKSWPALSPKGVQYYAGWAANYAADRGTNDQALLMSASAHRIDACTRAMENGIFGTGTANDGSPMFNVGMYPPIVAR